MNVPIGPPIKREMKNHFSLFLPNLWAYETFKRQNAKLINPITRNPVMKSFRLALRT